MAKCISCRKPNLNEVPHYPIDECVPLYEIFDGIWYCAECCEKYNLRIPETPVTEPSDWDFY
jgi:hypothetical protein